MLNNAPVRAKALVKPTRQTSMKPVLPASRPSCARSDLFFSPEPSLASRCGIPSSKERVSATQIQATKVTIALATP